MTRVYLPTFAELIDRMTIAQLKAIFISEHKAEYDKEIALIMQDVDTILAEKNYKVTAADIKAICALMLTNRYIWENESKARAGSNDQDKLLKMTHSVNGVRNTAKNMLAKAVGDRLDFKIDCFSADLVEEFGNWNLFV
jgi:hypothetical protein